MTTEKQRANGSGAGGDSTGGNAASSEPTSEEPQPVARMRRSVTPAVADKQVIKGSMARVLGASGAGGALPKILRPL